MNKMVGATRYRIGPELRCTLVLVSVVIASGLVSACAKPTVEQKAMGLARQHREEEGITALREAIAKDPNDVDARKLLVRLVACAGTCAARKRRRRSSRGGLKPGDPSA